MFREVSDSVVIGFQVATVRSSRTRHRAVIRGTRHRGLVDRRTSRARDGIAKSTVFVPVDEVRLLEVRRETFGRNQGGRPQVIIHRRGDYPLLVSCYSVAEGALDRHSGNARTARRLFEAALERHAVRIAGLADPSAELRSIPPEDVPSAF